MLLRGKVPALHSEPLISGTQTRALGFMMETDHVIHDGEWVRDFVLLPDAGNALHPAHRFGDQMIAVHMRENLAVQFFARNLVWAWGTFRACARDPGGSKPLYGLEDARIEPASVNEIANYFR